MTRTGHFRLVLTVEFPHNRHAVGLPRVTTHDLYTKYAETIETVLAFICRHKRLSADDAEEFAAWARMRLVEDDCAILRKYGGISSFKGFITVVISNLFLDWRIKEWGKWRPTRRAANLGPIAIELERLVLRDSVEYGQAVQLLVSKGVAGSDTECDDIWGQLRQKPRRRSTPLDSVDPPAPKFVDPLEHDARRSLAKRAIGAMHAAIALLPAQDQLVFRLRYQDSFTVARIAALIEEDQKRLYRRFDDIKARLKAAILASGISGDEMDDLFGEFGFDFGDEDPSGSGNPGSGPSLSMNARGVAT